MEIAKNHKIEITQAPTTSHTDEEMEFFYEDVKIAREDATSNHDMIMGYFNAIIGHKI